MIQAIWIIYAIGLGASLLLAYAGLADIDLEHRTTARVTAWTAMAVTWPFWLFGLVVVSLFDLIGPWLFADDERKAPVRWD